MVVQPREGGSFDIQLPSLRAESSVVPYRKRPTRTPMVESNNQPWLRSSTSWVPNRGSRSLARSDLYSRPVGNICQVQGPSLVGTGSPYELGSSGPGGGHRVRAIIGSV